MLVTGLSTILPEHMAMISQSHHLELICVLKPSQAGMTPKLLPSHVPNKSI